MHLDKLTIKSQEAVYHAKRLADHHSHAEVELEHLALALLEQKGGVVSPLLQRLGCSQREFADPLRRHLEGRSAANGRAGDCYLSAELGKALDVASKLAEKMKDEYVSTEHLFLAAIQSGGSVVQDIAQTLGVEPNSVLAALQSVRGGRSVTDASPEEKYETIKKYGRDLTLDARGGRLDPVIGRDHEIRRLVQVLSRRTKNNPVLIGEPGVGKTAIAEGLAQRIVESDVPEGLKGKRVISLDLGAMVAGAKYRGEFEDRFKAFLKEVTEARGEIILFIDELHTLVGAGGGEGSVDASNMIKPALARGELRCVGATTLDEYRKHIEKDPALERRFQPVLVDEPTVEDTVAILRGLRERYEVHHGVRIQDSAVVAAATLADRHISDRFLPDKAIDLVDEAASKLRMEIDSMPTEIDEVERRIMQLEIEREALLKEKDKASRSRLQPLEAERAKLTEENAARKLHWRQEKELIGEIGRLTEVLDLLHSQEDAAKRENNLEKAAEILYGKIPDIEEQVRKARDRLSVLQENHRMLKEEVTAEEIAHVVSSWTHIPVTSLLEEEREKLLNMEARLRLRVVGQDDALEAVSNAVRRSRAGVQDPNRPIGSFIFMGPTGVGKTELARALAEFLFDDEHAMIRVDMSEYMEKHSVSRLLGAPPGYVGYDEGGYLTEHVRRKPYSVVLLDEVEKAHPDVLNVMLQFLDDGRLTDGKGRTVNFTNTLIIMTSNLGGDVIRDTLSECPGLEPCDPEYGRLEKKVREVLRGHFRPEFLNRVDETILFHALSRREISRIVDIQLDTVRGYLSQRDIHLDVTDRAKKILASEGYDAAYGARPLKRVIQRRVLDALARQLLDGDVTDGGHVVADRKPGGNGTLLFSPKKSP